jgi:hypothetical protein
MEQIYNISNISPIIGKHRVQAIDENAEVTLQKGILGTFFLVESTIDRPTLENMLSTTQTAEEAQYLVDYAADRQQLKDEYQNTITQLQSIENAVSPTNAQVVAAVKFLAKTLRLLIKLLARLLT